MGWASAELSELSRLFIAECRAGATVLDIGAGFGAASAAALRAGARVVANDLHIEALRQLDGIEAIEARFPEDLHFDDASFDAIHSSSVLHFLTGRRIERGMEKIARWLRPGRRLFVQAASPYMKPFEAFVPEYTRRVAMGERWPGWIERTRDWSEHRLLGQMPKSVHLLDDRVLARAAQGAGLAVERAWMYRRSDLPVSLRLDGRESAGLVARRPIKAAY